VKRIAITGGISEGKSTVLAYLRDEGYTVESADVIARNVFELPETQAAIAELLQVPAPISAGQVRERMADAAFRRALNRMTHPRILSDLRSSKAAFVEVPLLIEACLQAEFDRIWVVTCGAREQLRRLAERLGDEAAAQALIGTQLTSHVKSTFADAIVRTNRDEPTVMRCVTVAARREFS
jgi:dephospho-CoA kinase